MHKNAIAALLVSLLSVMACGRSGSDSDADSVPAIPGNQTDDGSSEGSIPTDGQTRGSGAIDSLFNGYTVSTKTRRGQDGEFKSVSFYQIDTVGRVISEYSSSSENATIDSATLRYTTALSMQGLPLERSRFSTDGGLTFTEVFEYSGTGFLTSRTQTNVSTTAEDVIAFDYNSRGQLIAERALLPGTSLTRSRTDYNYNSDGLLLESVSSVPALQFTETTVYKHDENDRLSTWSKTNSFDNSGDLRGEFVWDSNGNLTMFLRNESLDSLSSVVSYTYESQSAAVYNEVLRELAFGPGGL